MCTRAGFGARDAHVYTVTALEVGTRLFILLSVPGWRQIVYIKRALELLLEWQHPRSNVVCQMTRRAERFNLMCHMPIFQGMGDSSKKRVNPKEDTGKASANVGMAASKIESCMPTGLSC